MQDKQYLQFSLPISLRPEFTFDNFYAGKNSQLLFNIQQSFHSSFYLWGGEQVGLSHLLQAVCHEMTVQNQSAIYLPMQELINYDHSFLANL